MPLTCTPGSCASRFAVVAVTGRFQSWHELWFLLALLLGYFCFPWLGPGRFVIC